LGDGSVTFLWNVDRDDVVPLLTDKRLRLAKQMGVSATEVAAAVTREETDRAWTKWS